MADAVKRLNYFDRQFLRANDFLDEQSYHLAMRRQHNRLLHSFGIVTGLELTGAAGAAQVKVSPGLAIDNLGREISLGAEAQSQPLSGFAGKTVFVTIRYDQQVSDPTSETGTTGNTRVTEGAKIEVLGETPPVDAGLQLILGRVTVAGDGTVSSTDGGAEPNRRHTAGIASSDLKIRSLALTDGLAGPADWPRLKMGAAGRADLTGSLSVTGDITAGGILRGTLADLSVSEAKLDAGTRGKLVTNGNAHDHSGGDGATIKHSTLNKDDGRNPHGTTAADVGAVPLGGGAITGDLTVSGLLRGTLADASIAETKLDAGTRAKLVTNGNGHDHSGGHGATIKHSALSKDDGTNPHLTTAADVKALPLAGGTLTGNLGIDGSLGIGTTTPVRQLHINDHGGVSAEMVLEHTNASADHRKWNLVVDGPAGASSHFYIRQLNDAGTGGNIPLLISETGNVGIGTLAPSHRFHVVAPDAVGLFESSGSQAYLRLYTNEGPNKRVEITNRPGGRLALFTVGGGDVLNITQDGKVGLGTATPAQRLHVAGDAMITGRIGTNNFPSTPKTPGWAGGIRTWDIEAEGTAWCAHGWQTGPRDLAENYVSAAELEAGDVVSLHPDRDEIVLAGKKHDPMVLGIVSTEPGLLLNADPSATAEPGKKLFPIALSGRVRCKVTDENGPIRRGDLLCASSAPGRAMKALASAAGGGEFHQPGTIIGKALESLQSGEGTVEVFVISR